MHREDAKVLKITQNLGHRNASSRGASGPMKQAKSGDFYAKPKLKYGKNSRQN